MTDQGKHTGCERGFTHTAASWYGPAVLKREKHVDKIMIGFYHHGGGSTGEFAIRWVDIGTKVTPKLAAYDDAWHALYEFRDVLAKLAEHDGENMPPEAVCALLVECGVKDMTERTRP